MKKQIVLVILLLVGLTSWAQKSQMLNPKKKVENGEMKTYYLVFLKKGTKRDQDSITSAKIQKGHMAHLNKMYADGKMDLAGPMMGDGDLRGICVYNVGSLEEAKKLVESDPAIISGRLVAEILPWYSQKGAVLR